MAAAAALSSGRGAAGVKGPFFIFTLLCLVCFVSSLIEKDQLEKLKEGHQKTQALLDNVKQLSLPSPSITVMAAAAALSSGRGAAGVKGPFFIFTLLCLVCFVSSLMKQDQLEKLKEGIQKAQQKLDKLKATRASSSELMSKSMSIIDPLAAHMKEASSGFPPIEEFMDSLKDFMVKTKAYADAENEEADAEIEKTEQELEKMRKFVLLIEDFQAEL